MIAVKNIELIIKEEKKVCIRCHSNKNIHEYEKIMKYGEMKILTRCKSCREKINKRNIEKKNKKNLEIIEY